VGEVFADDMAAGGAKDVADKKDIHSRILHAGGCGRDLRAQGVLAFCAWHRVDGFS
jgi:hypothetical protein